jgi:GTP diphosphokinase / guanosine-3',5'-bis(diphosphate) 3'-diphosphatase
MVTEKEYTDIERPAEFTDPDVLYGELVATIRRYRPDDDLEMLHRAYMTAKNAHMDQRRKSGEPYIIHPLCVAIILADLELDLETIMAGLLHDTEEDTIIEDSQIRRVFGDSVAELVDGVTKLTHINLTSDKPDKTEEQAENLRKMFLAMSKDIRVLLIKLADRLHNMRTLQHMTPEKQKEKARETLDIYSPLAQRLGISRIKVELDDLSLMYLEPEVYKELKQKVAERQSARELFIKGIVDEVSVHMHESDIKCEVYGRVKHLFSIYKKMVNQNKTIDQIYDLFAIRIIVDSIKDCYAALGIIHEHYKPIPGRFKDYIAMPKENMYQSLHTTVIGSSGQPFEVQIRTYEMHRIAEYGIAAHWKYKQAGASVKAIQGDDDGKLNWLKHIIEWQSDLSDNKEFLSAIKSDLNLFSDSVYCFTPQGEVKALPAGSTPVDFAYNVHTAVGNRMVGARANGQMVPIDYKIQNGDRIEIITSMNSHGPSRDWLKICKSSQAKNKINNWFKNELREDNIAKGKDLVDKYCKSKGLVLTDLLTPEAMEKVLNRYSFRDWNAVLASIGHGGTKENAIVNRLVAEQEKLKAGQITDEDILSSILADKEKNSQTKIRKSSNGIVVKGIHDLAVRFSHCCNPVPGDEIVGFVTRGRGISIHRTDCVNVINMPEDERARMIPAEWQSSSDSTDEKYRSEINIYAYNRKGLMVDISRIFSEAGIDISALTSHVGKNGMATISISFDVNGREGLRSITEKLRQIESVTDIERASS